jgi:hypothetical protein
MAHLDAAVLRMEEDRKVFSQPPWRKGQNPQSAWPLGHS